MSTRWQPYWQANTAYTLTAVVIPTIFGGYTWRCTTAGTSANVEPTWPTPTITPTIVDGGVTWTAGTGFRQSLSNGILSIVTAFATANPTIVRSIRNSKPAFSNVEFPVFYVGDLTESILHYQGVRTRTFSGFSAFLVDSLGGAEEAADRMDFAADVLTDLFTTNVHAASGLSIFQHTGTADVDVPAGDGSLPGLEFTFAEATVTEGRT
jgi:hypothetical protein